MITNGNVQIQLEIIARLLNGVVTLFISTFIYRTYEKNGKRFYLLWSLGFLSYSLSIIIRTLIGSEPVLNPTPAQWLTFILYMAGSILVIFGIGDLIEKTRLALISLGFLPLVPIIAYSFTNPETLGWIITLTPYFVISASLFFIKYRYKVNLDLFIVGWLILFITNSAWALNMMNPIIVDLFAIFGKIIIYIGMINPQFSFLAEDMKRFLISGLPEAYPDELVEHFFLVSFQTRERDSEIKWIVDKTRENDRQGIRTILITLYDIITDTGLVSHGLDRDSLYIVRMLPGVTQSVQSIEYNTATMDDGVNQLHFLISEIINFSNERKVRCDIILYTLSWLIHSQGWRRLFHLLVSKNPELKSSGVQMHFIYYPETHQSEEISKFEKIADRIITID